MNQKFKDIFTAKHILIGLTALCLLFIGLSFLYGDAANPVKNAVNKVVLPMQKGINSVGSRLFSSAEELAALKDAQEEMCIRDRGMRAGSWHRADRPGGRHG